MSVRVCVLSENTFGMFSKGLVRRRANFSVIRLHKISVDALNPSHNIRQSIPLERYLLTAYSVLGLEVLVPIYRAYIYDIILILSNLDD